MLFKDNVAEYVTNAAAFPIPLSGAVDGYRSFLTAYGADSSPLPLALRKSDGSAWMNFTGSYANSSRQVDYISLRSSSTGNQVVPSSGVWTLSLDWMAEEADKSLFVLANSQSTAYTTVISDAGKTIIHPSTDNNARTFTINGTLAYREGTVISFCNRVNTLTIALSSGTMYLAGSATTGNRTLAVNGVCTAYFIDSIWIIGGIGLT
jgi:hypothetical protein